jgi:uncharacterized hydrophobic protein (TIGR00341 family)
LLRLLIPAERVETLSDKVSDRFAESEGFRIMLFAVEATIPLPKEEEAEGEVEAEAVEESRERISREELYTDVASGAELGVVYVVTVALSAIVAAFGLMRGDVAVIIGAMVIAPLLRPNVALSLAITLGDISLALGSLKALAVGLTTSLAVAWLLGSLLSFDPMVPEIVSRTQVAIGDFGLALAAGAAGALAFTTGVPAGMIGVMVAVALLPPLVNAGMLAGAGYGEQALGALLLTMTNIVCINLAGVVTFIVQGIRPRRWWEAERARKATWIAIVLWALLLVLFLVVVGLWWRR